MPRKVCIIGAGPAGLTAAYLLAKENIPTLILEKDPCYVGGIARTVSYKDYHFDIGGHRFFSKSQEVEDFWSEILPEDFISCQRSSRIYYKKKFYSYPLKLPEVLRNLGLFESLRCLLSYIKAWALPVKDPKNFSDWVSNRFGKRLFSIFFKTYTEKVWGMRCEEISADWAAQRISNLSFISAVMNALLPKRKSQKVIKTLIDSFRYPRKGPGMLWERCAEKATAMGATLIQGCELKSAYYDRDSKEWIIEYSESNGSVHKTSCSHLMSSAPLQELVSLLDPAPQSKTQAAASGLKYRDFLIVALILRQGQLSDDNWVYVHDSAVTVARIQNFKAWSSEMVPNADTTCYGMEYFCFERDGLWKLSDQDLIAKASAELVSLGLAKKEDILDGCVVRQPKAYPVYDEHYKEQVALIKDDLEKHYPRLYLMGRNGMHKYNNQDHAMMTAMLSVKNILLEQQAFDVWKVNQDAEYIEAGSAGSNRLFTDGRQVPEKV